MNFNDEAYKLYTLVLKINHAFGAFLAKFIHINSEFLNNLITSIYELFANQNNFSNKHVLENITSILTSLLWPLQQLSLAVYAFLINVINIISNIYFHDLDIAKYLDWRVCNAIIFILLFRFFVKLIFKYMKFFFIIVLLSIIYIQILTFSLNNKNFYNNLNQNTLQNSENFEYEEN